MPLLTAYGDVQAVALQLPPVHVTLEECETLLVLHTVPQLPQLLISVCVLTQVEPVSQVPEGQTQAPLLNVYGDVQAVALQLPLVHDTDEECETLLVLQTVPQLPQLFISVWVLRHDPEE